MAQLRPLAVLLEDLHWADSTTLDLVEHVLAGAPGGPPLLGTWRPQDTATRRDATAWATRVRRMTSVQTLALQPLTREQTAEQLALLGRREDGGYVDRIHRRSQGQPLFTEQLAAHATDDESLPELLADLFDQRLSGLGPAAWSIARVLGVAGRPLVDSQVRAASGLSEADLRAGLHELDFRRLLRPSAGRDLQLQHPLLAEATRRRLLSLDLVDEHRRLAVALTDDPDPAAGEATGHEKAAGDVLQERMLRSMGRYRDGKPAIERATEAAYAVDDYGLLRVGLIELARHDALAGDLEAALPRAEEAWLAGVAPGPPQHEIHACVAYTDLLLMAARPAEEIAAVAVRGLERVDSRETGTAAVSALRSNVAEAFLRSGQVGLAADLVDPVTSSTPRRSTLAEHLERAAVDLRRGLLGEAAARLGHVSSLEPPTIVTRLEVVLSGADVDLWRGDPQRAVDRLLPVVAEVSGTTPRRSSRPPSCGPPAPPRTWPTGRAGSEAWSSSAPWTTCSAAASRIPSALP